MQNKIDNKEVKKAQEHAVIFAEDAEVVLSRREFRILSKNSKRFFQATLNQNINNIKSLIKSYPKIVIVRDKWGNTALHFASIYGDETTMQELLSAKQLDVNATNHKGNTALHYASMRGYQTIVQELLGVKEIDVNATNYKGNTALHYTSMRGYKMTMLELLGVKEINVNATNHKYNTALHYASMHGDETIIQDLLCVKEINVNARNHEGNTALHIAVEKKHLAITKELLKAKSIDVNLKDHKGNTALHYAINNCNITVCKHLMNKDADLSIGNIISLKELQLTKSSFLSKVNINFTELHNKIYNFYQQTLKRDKGLFNKVRDEMLKEYQYNLPSNFKISEILINDINNKDGLLNLLLCIKDIQKQIKQRIPRVLRDLLVLPHCVEFSNWFKERHILKHESADVIVDSLNKELEKIKEDNFLRQK